MKLRCVDRIHAWTPYREITGLKAVSFEEFELKAPFGDEAALPESLVLESLLQLGNWLLLLSSEFTRLGRVIRIGEVQFLDRLRPGQALHLRVTVTRRRAEDFEFAGEGSVHGRPLVRGSGCLATTVPAADYLNPADARVLFAEIGPPVESMPP